MEKEYFIIDDISLPERIELYKDIDYVEFDKSTEEVTMTVGQLTDLIVYAAKHYSVY